MQRVLMIAYHFPPQAGSSGIQRTIRFVQHLPRYGWQPLVLSADARAYERTGTDLSAEVPDGTVVRRAFALDAARHLAVGGRYPGFAARPDRWVTWKFDAVRQGLRLIREYRPRALWSTYPIATAHLIGAELSRRSGIPWVADFRDPMAQEGYPPDPRTHRRFEEIERLAARQASWCVFTTPGAARTYRARYPEAAGRFEVIENGYDEESFVEVERDAPAPCRAPLNPGAITLLHSGIVYPDERDPAPLFQALARLKAAASLAPGTVKIRFRAAVHDDLLRRLAAEHGLDDWIETLPAIGYREALQEMLRAEALLVLQGDNCNEQIPAKIYEYLRACRPIIALADPAGDTAAVLRKAGIEHIAKLESSEQIEFLLPRFVTALRAGRAGLPDARVVQGATRRRRAGELAALLDAATVKRRLDARLEGLEAS